MNINTFFVVFFFFIVVATTILVNAAGSATNSFNWADLPTTNPPSTDYTSLNTGTCMCDLTTGICDANCCCDPDCSSSTSAFTGCKRENGGNNQKLMCIEENSATEIVSSRDNIEVSKVRRFGADSVCVVDSNVVDREGISLIYSLPDETAKSSIVAPTSPWPASSSSSSSITLSVGDLLPIVQAVPAGASATLNVAPNNKYLRDFGASMPSTSNCDTDARAGFLKNQESHSCNLAGSALSTLCAAGGALNVDQFRYLAFARPDHDLSSINVVRPIKVRFVNDDTGALMEEVSAQPAFEEGFAPGTATVPTATVVTTFDGTNCLNGVASTRLSVLYATIDGITTVSDATLVVRVKPSRAPTASNLYQISSAARFTSATATFEANNDAPIASEKPRPGNPGYTRGNRILAGYSVASTDGRSAVYTLPNGLEVPLAGACSDSRFAGVPFLHDVTTSSCSLTLTEAQLQTYCSTGTLAALSAFIGPSSCGGAACPANVSQIVDRIGIDGMASSVESNDWVTVQGLPITNPTGLVYDSVRHQCSGLITGLHWTIGVARAGAVYNPQDIIVSAKVEPILGTWVYNAASSGLVRFNFKVSFVRLPEAGQYYRKEVVPPSLFPTVDEDVFYPFRRPDA